MRTLASAMGLLIATTPIAGAQEMTSPADLLAAAKAAYPGELCWWERAEEDIASAQSWTLTFRYDYEMEDGPDHTLVLHQLPCFYGAYNFGSLWFTETEFEGLVPLHFAVPALDIEYADEQQETLTAMKIVGFETQAALVNSEFDPDSRTIMSYSKWRGLGDASSVGTWELQAGTFVLTRYEVDPTFNGEFDSVTVFDTASN